MKLRSYLKGLGLGIFVTTLIVSLSSNNAKGEISDDEIRKRAAKLGMVSENTMLLTEAKAMADNAQEKAKSRNEAMESVSADTGSVSAPSPAPVSVNSNGEIIYKEEKKPVSPKEDSAATAGSTTESPAPAPEKQEEKPKAEKTNAEEKPVEDTSQKKQETAEEPSKIVTITINAGESSISVATKMVEAGLITDARQFDSYLVLSGYDRRLVIGSHPIPVDATPEEMGQILTTTQ